MGALGALGFDPTSPTRPQRLNPALSTLSTDLVMANAAAAATVVHSHTWYTGMAGHRRLLLHDIPHVLTAHSLEPLRPWKAEQLGGGYRVFALGGADRHRSRRRRHRREFGMRDDVLARVSGARP